MLVHCYSSIVLHLSKFWHVFHCLLFLHRSDYDIDCAGDLVCWYEDGSGTVPGCSGTPRQYWEYCIDPSVIPPKNVTHSDTLIDFGNGLGPAALGRCQGDCGK